MPESDPSAVRRRHLAAVDLVEQAAVGLVFRPRRSALAGASIAVGVAIVVAVVQLAASARAQLAVVLDRVETTIVEVSDRGEDGRVLVPDDTALGEVPGVRRAGWLAHLSGDVTSSPGTLDRSEQTITAATPGLFEAVDAVLSQGRAIGDRDVDEQVAVIGAALARRLGLASLAAGAVVDVDGYEFSVIGRLGAVNLHPELLDAIIIPAPVAERLFPALGDATAAAVLRTEPGTADAVARRAAVALAPSAPEQLVVRVDPAPVRLRRALEDQYRSTLVLVGAAVVAVGGLGVGLATSAAVDERRDEISVRRALGATRADIRDQFLLEGAMLASVASLVGWSLGMVGSTVVVLARGWPWGFGAPGVGGAVVVVATLLGAAAAWPPARAAARRTPGVRAGGAQ